MTQIIIHNYTHRAQHSSIAILLDNFYRRYLLCMGTILSLSACDSFMWITSLTSPTCLALLSLSGHISCSILIDELSRKRLLQNQLGKLQVLILILMKQQQKFSKFYLSKDFQIEELGYGCRHCDQFVQRIPLKVTQTILAKLIYR